MDALDKEIWARIGLIVGICVLIEGIDSAVDAINIPWWLSLLIASCCSISDIIVILVIDWLTE